MSSVSSALLALAPSAQWNLNDDNYSEIEWFSTDIQKPTQEEVDVEMARQDAQAPIDACKKQAQKILYETDWTTIPDIALPENNPRLLNQQEFITYRNTIRGYAINPVADPVWPTQPTEQWSS
jgi:hypothetical protein